jgi:hypothetical protein
LKAPGHLRIVLVLGEINGVFFSDDHIHQADGMAHFLAATDQIAEVSQH